MQYFILLITILLFSPSQAVAFDIDSYAQKKRAEAAATKIRSSKKISHMKHLASQGKPIVAGLKYKIPPQFNDNTEFTTPYEEIATAAGGGSVDNDDNGFTNMDKEAEAHVSNEHHSAPLSNEELERLGF